MFCETRPNRAQARRTEEQTVTETCADDFATIRARMEELRHFGYIRKLGSSRHFLRAGTFGGCGPGLWAPLALPGPPAPVSFGPFSAGADFCEQHVLLRFVLTLALAVQRHAFRQRDLLSNDRSPAG